jgi:hypothetical protein
MAEPGPVSWDSKAKINNFNNFLLTLHHFLDADMPSLTPSLMYAHQIVSKMPPHARTQQQFYYNPEHRHLFEAMLRHIDVFSPNHEEAAQLLGAPVTPDAPNISEVVRQLMAMGTRILALRCGAHGSVVACRNPEGLIRFCT